MEVTLTTIRSWFDSVLTGEMSREEASDWARQVREADDQQKLLVTPEADRKAVWDAIEFLEMYDMKNSPTEYLYAEEDLVAHRPSA